MCKLSNGKIVGNSAHCLFLETGVLSQIYIGRINIDIKNTNECDNRNVINITIVIRIIKKKTTILT